MAFHKFKLDLSRTNTPVPLAAAAPRSSAKHDQVQHESQRGAPRQTWLTDGINVHPVVHTDNKSHTGHGDNLDYAGPPSVQGIQDLPAPLPTSRHGHSQTSQTQHMTTSACSDGRKKRALPLDSSLESDASPFFLQGASPISPCEYPDLEIYPPKSPCSTNTFFFMIS